jgi:hypothetical protein
MGTILSDRELAALRGPQHWSADDAQAVLATWRASGLSRTQFCERHRFTTQRLYLWARQLGDWASTAEVSPMVAMASLVPAVVRSPGPATESIPTTTAPLTLRLSSGVALEFRDGVVLDPRWLAALVAALRGTP